MSKENDILKWYNNEISTTEIKALYPEEDFSTLEKAAFYAKQLQTPEVDAERALAEFKTSNSNKNTTKVVPLNYKSFLKIAAVLLIMLVASYALFFNNDKSYNTGAAEIASIYLPDETEVILNAQSDLSYNNRNWKIKRSLKLDGEAYFKVTKGKKFTVITDAGTVQVLGTEFNVKERSNYFEVQCYEGSVSVVFNNKEVTLKAGDGIRAINGSVESMTQIKDKSPSWLTHESSFNNVPLWQVIDELEIQYNLTISADNVDTSVLFSGSFTHKDKNIALLSVTIPLKLSYKINDDKVEFYNYEAN